MRITGPVLCLLLVSGCAGGTDAALTGKDASSKLAVKDGALARLAQTQLTVVKQAAQAWAAEHGGVMTGFADDLRTSQPSVASTMVELADTSVTVAVAGGQCLTLQLPAGSPVAAAC
jgi:hypothetical protein